MNIKLFLLALLLISPVISHSETNALTTNGKSTMPKPDFTNTLTPTEREDLIATIKIAMRIIVDNNLLDEHIESKFFNSFRYSYPKNGPIDRATLTKNDLLNLSFINRSKDEIIWKSGGISFNHNRFNTDELTTLFTPEDFTKALDLTFEKANKEVVEYNGKEVGSYYLYTYHWKLNSKLKVMFKVQDKFFIEKDNYPRDFFIVDLELE